MTEQEQLTNCIHCNSNVKFEDTKTDWGEKIPKICGQCGFLPFTKVSQQPHGNQTLYCNMCQMYVKPASDDGSCPYHQKLMDGGEEGPFLRYDEFDQNGEAY